MEVGTHTSEDSPSTTLRLHLTKDILSSVFREAHSHHRIIGTVRHRLVAGMGNLLRVGDSYPVRNPCKGIAHCFCGLIGDNLDAVGQSIFDSRRLSYSLPKSQYQTILQNQRPCLVISVATTNGGLRIKTTRIGCIGGASRASSRAFGWRRGRWEALRGAQKFV